MRPLCVVLLSTAARYGTPTPPDIASQYWRLAGNLHVQLMAGTHDGIIPPVNVQRHYQAMQAAGMKVSQVSPHVWRQVAYVLSLLAGEA
jgi:predicted esterase